MEIFTESPVLNILIAVLIIVIIAGVISFAFHKKRKREEERAIAVQLKKKEEEKTAAEEEKKLPSETIRYAKATAYPSLKEKSVVKAQKAERGKPRFLKYTVDGYIATEADKNKKVLRWR
jgi:cytoskeletal protein RodZ